MVRIIMHGCNGKMGQVITRMAAEDKECEIVAGIDTCEGRLNGYPVFDSLQDCDVEADVVIDFSNAKETLRAGRLLLWQTRSMRHRI